MSWNKCLARTVGWNKRSKARHPLASDSILSYIIIQVIYFFTDLSKELIWDGITSILRVEIKT